MDRPARKIHGPSSRSGHASERVFSGRISSPRDYLLLTTIQLSERSRCMIFCFETDSISPSGLVPPETLSLLIDRSGENYESGMYMRTLRQGAVPERLKRNRPGRAPWSGPVVRLQTGEITRSMSEALFERMELAADGDIIPCPRQISMARYFMRTRIRLDRGWEITR